MLYWMDQAAQLYIRMLFAIQTPRQNAAIPRPEGNFLMLVNFILSLVSISVPRLYIPTFV